MTQLKAFRGICSKCGNTGKSYTWRSVTMCAPCLSGSSTETNVRGYRDKKGISSQTCTRMRIINKIQVNKPCPCGSGLKYKKCCK